MISPGGCFYSSRCVDGNGTPSGGDRGRHRPFWLFFLLRLRRSNNRSNTQFGLLASVDYGTFLAPAAGAKRPRRVTRSSDRSTDPTSPYSESTNRSAIAVYGQESSSTVPWPSIDVPTPVWVSREPAYRRSPKESFLPPLWPPLFFERRLKSFVRPTTYIE